MSLAALYDPGIPRCYQDVVFQHLLEREIKRSLRYSEFFTLLLLSPDQHNGRDRPSERGMDDRILALMFWNLHLELRETDFIGRYSSHLGTILLHAPFEGAWVVADRIRQRIGQFSFPSDITGGPTRLTVSVGGACFPTHGRDQEGLLHCALLSLDRAREAGGDRTVMS